MSNAEVRFKSGVRLGEEVERGGLLRKGRSKKCDVMKSGTGRDGSGEFDVEKEESEGERRGV